MTSTEENTAPSAWIGGTPYRLWRANQGVHRRLNESIADLGVTVTQLGIVVHLDELGHMSASDLARLFGLTPQSVSTALGQLEKLGWVTRVPHPVHKRVIWYEATDAGVEAAVHGRERVATVNQEVADALTDEERAAFDSALTSLLRVFGEEMPYTTMWPLPGWSRPNRSAV